MKRIAILALLPFLALFGGNLPAAGKEPLQVYILAGQSNMQGHAQVRTFEHIGMDPATAPLLEEMIDGDANPRVCERVWISSIGCAGDDTTEQTGRLTAGFGAPNNGPKIGPEFTFGLTMEKLTGAPILLIKTAWGGKSLHTDFRPPGAGPYVFPEEQLEALRRQGKDLDVVRAEKAEQTGAYYRLMVEHVKAVLADLPRVAPDHAPADGHELAGFVWFQGWNDLVDAGAYPRRDQAGGYDAYSEAMAHFIRDIRRDLGAPELPFVIGVLGVGGPTADYGPAQQRYRAVHQNFRDAMAAPAQFPEFRGNVAAVLTERFWDRELSEFKAKEDALKQQAKKLAEERGLSSAEERAAFERLRAEGLDERERRVLETGISNFEFHYLGSAKILGGIGKAFAEEMARLRAK